MSVTVAPYGLDDPYAYDHYEDFTAMLAGRLVERNEGLDVLLDVLARHCDSEYGLSDEDRSDLSRYLAESTNLLAHVEAHVVPDFGDWVVEHTYSDIDRADMALYMDVLTELHEFVAQRYCEVNDE